MRKIHTTLTLLSAIILLASALIMTTPVKADLGIWKNKGWIDGHRVTLTETAGVTRVNEPVDIFLYPTGADHCVNATKEIRVVAPDNSEVPSQVYNITMEGGYVKSCNVVFLANCSAFSSTAYHIIYNNTAAEARKYDGLRLIEEQAGDAYTVNITKAGVEKKYFRIFWKNCVWLWSNGSNVAWAGGQSGWEFFPIGVGTLWGDVWGGGWFGSNISLCPVIDRFLGAARAGPIFVEFNYTEAGGSDWTQTVFNYNVTTSLIIRVYYQPDLNPLVYYHRTFHIKTNLENYTVKTPYYLDFKLANRTSQAIYQSFTWKNTAGTTSMVSTDQIIPTTEDIYSPASPLGWWSFNGSRPDSPDKPAANMGLVPTYSGGSITGADYTLRVVQRLEYDDHHCSQWFKGSFIGVAEDTIETEGYIVTYTPVDQNVASTMEENAKKLRTPLEYSVGPQFIIPEFPFIGALIILVLLCAIAGLRKLPILKRLRLEA